jgi:hypothetical protein
MFFHKNILSPNEKQTENVRHVRSWSPRGIEDKILFGIAYSVLNKV